MDKTPRTFKFKQESIVAMELYYCNDKKLNVLTIFLAHGHSLEVLGKQAADIYDTYLNDDNSAFKYTDKF